MGLFDSSTEEPKSKVRRYLITIVALAAMLAGGVLYLLRFHTEKRTVEAFFEAVTAGDMQQAYRIWKPGPTYSFENFLGDFGPQGYYGPIKSYSLQTIQRPRRGGSGVIAVVDVSSRSPFPDGADAAASKTIKEVRLWVERKDQSLSFPP